MAGAGLSRLPPTPRCSGSCATTWDSRARSSVVVSRRAASRRKGGGGLMRRRGFPHGTGTVGAGLVIGFRLPARHGVLPFAPNAWLRIDADGTTTITIDKSEMGEGNHTALAMLIAEELDADWTKVKIGPVPENPAGWSRRMSTGGSTSVRTSWDILRKAGATARAMLIAAGAREWGVEPAPAAPRTAS